MDANTYSLADNGMRLLHLMFQHVVEGIETPICGDTIAKAVTK